MVVRPNVRARCYQPNLQARHPGNRKYYFREYPLYSKQCRWCHRPVSGRMDPVYFGLCLVCGPTLGIMDKETEINRLSEWWE